MATQNDYNPKTQCAVESKDQNFNLLSTPNGLHLLLISYILSVMKDEVSSSEVVEFKTLLISLDICCLFFVLPRNTFHRRSSTSGSQRHFPRGWISKHTMLISSQFLSLTRLRPMIVGDYHSRYSGFLCFHVYSFFY